MTDSKPCTKCKQVKPITSEFWYSDKGQSSGWKPECRDCTLAIKKLYYANNKEMLRERSRKYRENNPELWKSIKARNRRANPEKTQSHRRTRYMRRFGGNHVFYTVNEVIETYGTHCHLCGLPVDMTAPRATWKKGWEYGLQIDHVIRLADGGDDTLENVRPAHGLCNMKKN